jgi:lipoprotein-releasing system permease protein
MNYSSTKVNWDIARTHLMSRKKQTLIALLGVTFGISMFITMISFMTGVNDYLRELTLDGTPHIRMFNPVEIKANTLLDTNPNELIVLRHQKPKNELPRIKNGLRVLEEIKAIPEVSGALAQVSSQVFFNNGPIKIPGMVVGTDIIEEDKLYGISEKMLEGQISNLLAYRDGILVGTGLAEKMGVKNGDRIALTTPEGNTFFFRVVGTFAFGLGAIDDLRCYTSLSSVQKLLGKDPSYITEIQMKVHQIETARLVSKKLRDQYHYRVEDWEEANQAILVGEIIRNSMTYIVSITMLIVAGFGIYNIMNMNIINKMKDIAILKATGFEGKDIRSIFMYQSLFIGFVGGCIGLLFGLGFSLAINQIPFPKTGFITLETFPVNFKWQHYMMGLIFGLLTTLMAGIFPSRKASRIDPVEIIRG